MSLITCQAAPNSWVDWCAQPGTDVFGLPWNSWSHGGPNCNCAAGECKFGRQRMAVQAVAVQAPVYQLELSL